MPQNQDNDKTQTHIVLTKGTMVSHYRIIQKIGAGGMGEVYLAEDTKLKRQVALKFLSPHLWQDEDCRARFKREAQAAAKLSHPNIITVFEVSEFQGRPFFAMEHVEGRSLREFSADKDLSIEQILELGIQICEGLNDAHEKGVTHRDIKPSNILIDSHGRAKIVDFGLASVVGSDQLTKTGSTLGTIGYMSPEQVRGEAVDHRTDLFSLGTVLYELIIARRPFQRDSDAATLHAITHETPEPLSRYRTHVPSELESIVRRALEKDREKRFQSANEVLQQLEELRGQMTEAEAKVVDLRVIQRILKKPRVAIPLSVILAFLAAAMFFIYQHRTNVQQARELLPQIEELAQVEKYFEAFDLAVEAEKHIKNDPKLDSLMPLISDRLSVITQPQGAHVHLKPFAPLRTGEQQEHYVGITPISDLRIPCVDHIVRLEKEGFAPEERLASSRLTRIEGWAFGSSGNNIEIEVQLSEWEKIQENMVFVPRGDYELVGWGSPTTAEVQLDDYFIDKYEVSNKSYKAFIDSGGYQRKEYWAFSFINDGKELTWKEATELLKDRTGLPGPRGWINQNFPEDQQHYPVTGITWYEAAAYAEFAEKSLPTIFQWEKAARAGRFTHTTGVVMPWGYMNPKETVKNRANFEGSGLCPVSEYEFGISPYGCYNMAGNAKEWCRNEMNGGYIVAGGSCEDPAYMFAYYGSLSGFHSSSSLGFRCVRNTSDKDSDQGAMTIKLETEIPSYTPVDAETFQSFLSHYQYDKRPLDAQVVEVKETADWSREKVTFDGGDGDRIIAYLYLPKHAAKPYQCLSFIPGGNVFWASPVPWNAEWLLAPHIKAGRAVLAVVPKGAVERRWGSDYSDPELHTVRYREETVLYATEFSLGLDYLSTRGDIDMDKIAYVGLSWGACDGPIFASVENRYSSAILVGGGFDKSDLRKLPEANPIHFAPYVMCPVMLLNGKYDEITAYGTSAQSLFNLLPEPKKLALVEGGHCPTLEVRVPVVEEWLDETLGPVKYKQE